MMAEGLRLEQDGRREEAEALYRQVAAAEPDNFVAWHRLGVLRNQRGDPEESARCLDLALELNPRSALAHYNMALALWNLHRPEEALGHLGRAIVIQPDLVEAHLNRSIVLDDLGRREEALASVERALALQPDHVLSLMNRGTLLHALGRNQEALASYDRALALQPDHAASHSNKIFVLDFEPELSFEQHQAERRRYWLAQAGGIQGDRAPFANDRDPSRPLVLGYVSADFRRHSAATCFGPVLRHHDRARFRIVCYSGVPIEDEWTRQFQRLADLWRPIANLTDQELAEQIRADGVDILIDLSGHSKGNRLLAFARKPAPVQVTAWGHSGGTGLPAVDYQFTDPVHFPEWARPLCAEACFDLPCLITFEVPELAPAVQDSPARARGCVTFGSLNRFSKVSRSALELWARILAQVPGSRLLLKDFVMEDPSVRPWILGIMAGQGVGPERIELRGATSRPEHLATYGEVDIVLDTFPHNGGITTWEALWMGAPVLTLLGGSPVSRISAAILHALELDDWVAAGQAEYLALAVAKAADLDGLARFRAQARARISGSAAGDPERYTRAVEAAYRSMWRRWLAGQDPVR